MEQVYGVVVGQRLAHLGEAGQLPVPLRGDLREPVGHGEEERAVGVVLLLEDKVTAFLASVRQAGEFLADEAQGLDDDDERFQTRPPPPSPALAPCTPSRSTSSTSS
ncbi:MAG: hypothetical protein M3P34_10195 [Actinomycetota bacterium]|nr:hypothetical protein [Actinomycetota bacterium]